MVHKGLGKAVKLAVPPCPCFCCKARLFNLSCFTLLKSVLVNSHQGLSKTVQVGVLYEASFCLHAPEAGQDVPRSHVLMNLHSVYLHQRLHKTSQVAMFL
eukprot:1161068-Pelagomonas_calceolata.AAC.1